MGMEVLDNLPHDKIRGKIRHKLEQAEVVRSKDDKAGTGSNQQYTEKLVPLSDPLLKRVLRLVPNYYTHQSASSLHTDASWVPSIACGVLYHAIHQRPNLGLVMADFDWLPPPDLEPDNDNGLDGNGGMKTTKRNWSEIPADGSPIVTDMEGKDHESYLTAPSHCDILFPTDFEKLASFVKRCLPAKTARTKMSISPPSAGASRPSDRSPRRGSKFVPSPPPSPVIRSGSTPVVRVEKQSQFLKRWGPEHVAKTKSWLTGHTPLMHDFVNCSVLTISQEQYT
mmetsp:Transcript_2051/g.4356  ORF Transcript_2051/g.4356 Transcript_2051/m.4356 type:complete len:282 (-) Transcript_2051:2511-3356(-)